MAVNIAKVENDTELHEVAELAEKIPRNRSHIWWTNFSPTTP